MGKTTSKDQMYAFAFHDQDQNQEDFMFPSVVGSVNNKIVTGFAAENLVDCHKSFKMWLPKLAGAPFDQMVTNKYPNLEDDIFSLGTERVSAKELAIIHVAEVLRRVLNALSQFEPNTKFDFRLNVACPLGPVLLNKEQKQNSSNDKHNDTKEKYINLVHEIGWRAWDLVKVLSPSIDACKATDILFAHEKQKQVKQMGEDNVMVMAEAHAAVISYIMHPGREKGRYITVDIGAGTTDSAMFWLTSKQIREALYYSFETAYYGMDDIDILVFQHNEAKTDLSPRKYREKRGLKTEDREIVLKPLSKMWDTFRNVFGKSYKKEPEAMRWHENGKATFKVLLLGGGSEQPLIQEEFERPDRTPWEGQIDGWDVDRLEAKQGRKVLLEDGSVVTNGMVAEKYDHSRIFLVIAEGLAHRAVETPPWDIQENPVSIINRPISDHPTHDDLYG